MNQALLQRVLEGDEDAQARFGESDHCAVIDWRDGPAEIVKAVAAFLPQGYLAPGRLTQQACELLVQGKAPVVVPLPPKATQERLLLAISDAIGPEFELRQFTPMDGDGYSVFVGPRAVWSAIGSTHPEATERLFLDARRLAAYWSKGYLGRLFSKP
jgi:hypothetical protein